MSSSKSSGSRPPPSGQQLRTALAIAGKRPIKIWPLVALGGAAFTVAALWQSIFTVEPGHRAIVFNKLFGTRDYVFEEGTHLKVPFLEEPIHFHIRATPADIRATTGSKDLQRVNIALRVLWKPVPTEIPQIFRTLGLDYHERVLPSIVNEICRAVVARYTAANLLAQRSMVSEEIKTAITDRARDFHILLEDVSVTDLDFGKEFRQAVEAKQVAQQEAQRARFLVERALKEKESTIIMAEGEAEAAKLIGRAVQDNPNFLQIRKLEAAKDIAETLAGGNNKVMISSDSLLLDSLSSDFDDEA